MAAALTCGKLRSPSRSPGQCEAQHQGLSCCNEVRGLPWQDSIWRVLTVSQ